MTCLTPCDFDSTCKFYQNYMWLREKKESNREEINQTNKQAKEKNKEEKEINK